MKKLLIASLVATLTLSGCKKQEEPTTNNTENQALPTTTSTEESHTQSTEHGHEHDHHEVHDTHEHQHHHGKSYKCDNETTVTVSIHDHEGEIEAHATIDDIEYDLHPAEDGKTDVFISQEDGIGGKGMKMLNTPDDKITFTSLDDKEVLLNCNPV